MAAEEQISISGKITAVLEKREGTTVKGDWVCQSYVLKTSETYPKSLCFEVWGADKIEKADLKAGDEVNIGINIESRESNGRWFTSVKAWRVSKKGQTYDKQTGEPQPNNAPVGGGSNNNDSLPF